MNLTHAVTVGVTELIVATAAIWIPVAIINALRVSYFNLVGHRIMRVLGVIGVPIHELSHLIAAVLSGHSIGKVKLFTLSDGPVMGYVTHSYRPGLLSSLTCIIIGIAPLIGGIAVFYLLTWFLVPDLYHQLTGGQLDIADRIKVIGHAFTHIDARLIAWALLSFLILSFITPSKADFKGCLRGFLLIFIISVIGVLIAPGYAQHAFQGLATLSLLVAPPLVTTVIVMSFIFGLLLLLRLLWPKAAQQKPSA